MRILHIYQINVALLLYASYISINTYLQNSTDLQPSPTVHLPERTRTRSSMSFCVPIRSSGGRGMVRMPCRTVCLSVLSCSNLADASFSCHIPSIVRFHHSSLTTYILSLSTANPPITLPRLPFISPPEFAQVGNDTKATNFLGELDNHPQVGGLIDCTSNFEIEQEEMMRKSGIDLTPEMWLVKLLM